MIGAIAAAIFSFAKWAFTASTFAAFAVRTAIVMGASYLINRALAPAISDAEQVTSYALGPQTTESEAIAVQVHYGDNRIHANIVGHYTVIGDGLVGEQNISRNVLACFGEGPIEQPDDTSIRINSRPLSDFPGLTTQWRLGTVDQTALDAWTVFRQDYAVGQTALCGEPITMTLPRTGFDDLEVHLKLPNGLIHYGNDGDTHTELLAYKIEVGDAIGDTWQTLVHTTIGGRTASTCWLRYVASGSYPGGSPFVMTSSMQPRVRVTKLTGDSTNPRHIHDLEFAAVQVVKNVAFTHPGMVLLNLGLVPTEATTGGVSEVSVESTGRIVADENGNFATSRYHADAIRDILTQPVIEGDGSPEDPWTASYYRGVDPARLVDDGFAAQKTLADKLVPDGQGNNVPMLRCDAVFSNATSVYEAVGKVGASGRCGLDYRGRRFGLWLESTRYPVGILCDGNCERGSISVTPIQNDKLASEASVRYRDAAASYKERSILVIDHEFDTLTTVNLQLEVATRTHEVSRLARRELARNRLVDLSAEGRSDVNAAVYEAGDIAYVQIDGRSQGGRVTAVSTAGVVLDRSIEEVYTADDALMVQTRNPSTGEQALEIKAVAAVSPDGKTITINGSWTITPQVGDAFLFGPYAMIEHDQFEVTDASADEHLHTSLSLVRYVPALDDLDDLPPKTPIPVGIMQRVNHYSGIVRASLPRTTIDAIGTKPKVPFDWGNYTFAAGDPGEITWSSDIDGYGEASGFVTYNGALHQPADNTDGTAETWVYWDPATPTVFLTTNDLTDVVGRYLIAKNDNGTPITGFGCVPLDYTSAVWDKITGDGKPADNADVTQDNQVGAFYESFEDPNGDVASRWVDYAGYGAELSIEAGGSAGGKVLRVGDNAGLDTVRLIYHKSIPFDPAKMYRLRCRVRRTAGSGPVHIGVAGRDATDTEWRGVGNTNSPSGQYYVAAYDENPGSSWTEYTGYFKGHGSASYVAHPDPASPGVLATEVAYFRPCFLLNSGGVAGITEVDMFCVDVLPETADQIPSGSSNFYAGEAGADVTANHQGDVNIDNIADGDAYKKLSAAHALALQSAINLDTPQPRDGWEGAFTDHSPTAGYVAWLSFKIRWQGGDWTIAAGNTVYKYLYWNAGATKTQLYSSDAIVDAIGTGKFIIGVNDSGVFYPAQFLKVLHGALIQAATILAGHISVEDLSAIAAVFSSNLGGTYRLRIDNNGIYGSDDSGATWDPIIEQRDSGVKLTVNLVETDMIVDGAVNNIDSASVSSNLDFGTMEMTAATVSNFAASGGLVHLIARAQLQSEGYAADIVTMHLYRNTTEVAWKTVNVSQDPAWEPGELDWHDSPIAGTYTYYLKVDAAYGACNAQNRQLIVQEALK